MLYDLAGLSFCAGIIFFAGKRLSHYGDLLAERTGMGKAWIGLILMAAVTSLPELMVGISSSAFVGSADLAVGDVLGSCAFNLGILSLMDVFLPRDQPLFKSVSKGHVLAASFSVILVVMAGLGLFLDQDIVLTPSIGLSSISFALVYFLSMRTLYRFQHATRTKTVAEPEDGALSLRQVLIRYSAFSLLIILTALALPHFADRIAEHTGLGKSFVGTLFLAASTSLPEIAISIAAVRMGAADMAVGNLLGSNIFNILILFLDDLFYTRGHILKDASDTNLLSVFFVVMMTAVAIIGFMFPNPRKRIFMATDTLTIFILYVLNIVLLYQLQ